MSTPLPPGAESQVETLLEQAVTAETVALAEPGAGSGDPPETLPGPRPEIPSETPIAYRAVRGGLWLTAASYWSIGFGFIANILLTRMLTPEIYGEYALATFFAMFFTLRTKVGLNYAYAQERAVTGATVGTMFSLDVLLGIGGVVIGLVAAPILLAFGYATPVVAIMLTLLVVAFVDSLYGVFIATLEKDLRFKPGSVIASIILPLSYLPAFWFAYTGRGGLSLIGQSVAFSVLTYCFFGAFIWLRMRGLFTLGWRFDRPLARRYLGFGAMTGLAGFISNMVLQTDNFIVGTRTGTVTLGYYDRGYRTAQWPNLLLNTMLSRSALFTYAQLKDDTVRIRKTFRMVAWLTIGMAAPIGLGIAIAGPDLIRVVYGERWLPAVPIMQLLVVAAVLRPIWDNAYALFVGYGRPQRAIWIGGLQLSVLFVLGWLLAGFYGSIGVAVAVIVAYLVALVLAWWYTRDVLALSGRDLIELFGAPLLAAVLTLASYWLLHQVLPIEQWPPFVRIIGGGLYGALGFYAISFLIQPRATRDRVQYVLRLLRRREA